MSGLQSKDEWWPVEFLLRPKGKLVREVQDLRDLCGFTHPRRKSRHGQADTMLCQWRHYSP